jgi:hypothetical protein
MVCTGKLQNETVSVSFSQVSFPFLRDSVWWNVFHVSSFAVRDGTTSCTGTLWNFIFFIFIFISVHHFQGLKWPLLVSLF